MKHPEGRAKGGDPSDHVRSPNLPRNREAIPGSDGLDYTWIREIIRDARLDGTSFTWEAYVCISVSIKYFEPLWSPAYQARSQELARIKANTSGNARQVRVPNGAVERFAALEIFERDNWVCQLCEKPIDSMLKWPDPLCASLDHIQLVSAGIEQ